MSVTKNKETRYHQDAQDVKYKTTYLRIDNIDNPQSLIVRGGLNGRVGIAEGVVDTAEAAFTREDFNEHFTATEKTAAKKFAAACERVLALKVEELKDESHDGTDVLS